MRKFITGSSLIIILVLFPLIVFSQKTTLPKKKYMLYPNHETYDDKIWIILSQITFYQLLKQSGDTTIDRDYSTFDIAKDKNFRIFIDKAGNQFYWIKPELKKQEISKEFTVAESKVKDAWNKSAVLYSTKYPYARDTIVPGTRRYNESKRVLDTMVVRGSAMKLESSGKIVVGYKITDNGFLRINMLLISSTTGKEVLLVGGSQSYGNLCKLMRYIITSDNVRDGMIQFLESCGKGNSIENNMSFLVPLLTEVAPDALEKLPRFKPYRVEEEYGSIPIPISPSEDEKDISYDSN